MVDANLAGLEILVEPSLGAQLGPLTKIFRHLP
jgi:hypothetical protein